jgi:hypothetical protein
MFDWLLRRLRRDGFEDVASGLETRAASLAQRSEAAKVGNDEVVFAIAQFIRVLGGAKQTMERLTYFLIALTLGTLWLVVWQIRDARHAATVQNNIALTNSVLGDPDNIKIFEAIEKRQGAIVAQFTSAKIDSLLGAFEMIDDAVKHGLLTEHQLCVSFSYYIVLVHDDPELRAYVLSVRKDAENYYAGLDSLYRTVTRSADPTCRPQSGVTQTATR